MVGYFLERFSLIRRMGGTARVFAIAETICFPLSILTVLIVALHAIVVFVSSVAAQFGMLLPTFTLPNSVAMVLVSAAVGYLTNYIAIQMLYYPVSSEDLSCSKELGDVEVAKHESGGVGKDRVALKRSKIISLSTLGFWSKGLIPRNRQKVAWQIGLIAEERFVTPKAIAKILPHFTRALLSKNNEGKVRGVEVLRTIVDKNRDGAAKAIRGFCVGFLRNGDKSAIRQFVSKIGRSEVVSEALTNALMRYVQENPEQVVASVREIVSEFTQKHARPRVDEGTSFKDMISQTFRGITSAAIEGIAEVGLPQIKNFLMRCATDPERKRSIREKLASLLPIMCDQMSEHITKNPELLDAVISGDSIERLINAKFDDESFWDGLGDVLAPCVEGSVVAAFTDMPPNRFSEFFGNDHFIANNVKNTIMEMPLLDFYSMLDGVMAEHLGAIQVFGFVLGAAIGYIQYTVLLAQSGAHLLAYCLMGVPIVFVLLIKIGTDLRVSKSQDHAW